MICRKLSEPEICPTTGRTLALQKGGALVNKSQFSLDPCGVKCIFWVKNEIKIFKENPLFRTIKHLCTFIKNKFCCWRFISKRNPVSTIHKYVE